MARGDYSAVPLKRQQSVSERAAHEMDAAFESDDEEEYHESTPLAGGSHSVNAQEDVGEQQLGEVPAYDFERDYDYPPPGSPPAMPSPSGRTPAVVGNSNGIIPPTSPTSTRGFDWAPRNRGSGAAAFFRRAVGAILPTHYTSVPTSANDPARGSGVENDGVFSNVLAHPTPAQTARDENGNVYEVPEDAQKDAPPSYATAQADAVPPYWETTIHAPAMGSQDEPLIDGIPAGSIFSFAWNFLISISFQFVGFMVTYLLHTSHASKYGSRAGLGVTLIQYGLYSRESDMENVVVEDGVMGGDGGMGMPADVSRRSLGLGMILPRLPKRGLEVRTWSTMVSSTNGDSTTTMQNEFTMSSAHDWLSFLLMTLGWFLLLSSVLGFIRAKRWERSIRESANPQPAPSPEAIAQEMQVREHLRNVFGIEMVDDDVEAAVAANEQEGEGDRLVHPEDESQEPLTDEQRREDDFRRDLRAVGLL
ncbi:hypothetical protein SCHPADRAFT_868676 [Schizopora paradoxa]|uniref:Metal homeostatis protein bsd2 n=1 Tax=Schizopora paradoxa TaxID=27342 RepID=A0A0H2S661_9AGAM|nr:hypothetical protein SCHPADRAFT_868676 [Schizopora paradoxa]